MKYLKKFEKSEADILRNKYVGKYVIIKSSAYDMVFYREDMNKEIYFLIYFIPGTSDGYIHRTYTSLIVGFKDTEIVITLDKNKMKNIKKWEFSYKLVKFLNLSDTDKIALYTTKKYDDAIEMLKISDKIDKYNI